MNQSNIITFLHTGDIHFDIKYHNQIDENGYPLRLAAALYAWDQLSDYAIERKVDGVIIAGDIFHTAKPGPLAMFEFAKRIKKLSKYCSIYILPGNHDQTAIKGAINSLDLFKEVFEDNDVTVINENKWIVSTTKSGKQVILHFLSWLSTIQERRAYLKATVKDEDFIKANNKFPQILIAHGVASGAKTGFGFDVDRFGTRTDDYYTTKELIYTSPQYVALGHIHKYQVLCEEPPIIYCGSLHDCDFGEANFEKGFVELILDLNNPNNSAKYEFIPVKQKQKFTSLSIESAEEIPNRIKELSDEERNGIIRFVSSNDAILDQDLKELAPEAQQVQVKYEIKSNSEDSATRVRDINFQASSSIYDSFNLHFEGHEKKEDVMVILQEILNKQAIEEIT